MSSSISSSWQSSVQSYPSFDEGPEMPQHGVDLNNPHGARAGTIQELSPDPWTHDGDGIDVFASTAGPSDANTAATDPNTGPSQSQTAAGAALGIAGATLLAAALAPVVVPAAVYLGIVGTFFAGINFMFTNLNEPGSPDPSASAGTDPLGNSTGAS